MGRVLTGYATARVAALGAAGMLVLAGCNGAVRRSHALGERGVEWQPDSLEPPPRHPVRLRRLPRADGHCDRSRSGPSPHRRGRQSLRRVLSGNLFRLSGCERIRSPPGSSAPGCGGCQSLFDLLDEYRAKGQHVNKSSLVVKESSSRSEGSKDRPVVDVLAIDNPKQILRQDGSLVSKVAGANINFRLTEEWTGYAGRMTDLRVVR